MSSSDARRGAVLGADALAAYGLASSTAWHPLELGQGALVDTRHHADELGDAHFDRFDLEALDDVAPADASWDADASFANALPDFLTLADTDAVSSATPELSLARERALREEHARAHAEHVAAEAVRHEQELSDAYAAGIAAGQAEGAEAAERMLESAMQALHDAHAQLQLQEERWLAHLHENVAALAIGVARHVIGREIGADDGLVRTRVAARDRRVPARPSAHAARASGGSRGAEGRLRPVAHDGRARDALDRRRPADARRRAGGGARAHRRRARGRRAGARLPPAERTACLRRRASSVQR